MNVISYSPANYRIIEISIAGMPFFVYTTPPIYKLQKQINLLLFKFWYTIDTSMELKPHWFNYPLMKENQIQKNA